MNLLKGDPNLPFTLLSCPLDFLRNRSLRNKPIPRMYGLLAFIWKKGGARSLGGHNCFTRMHIEQVKSVARYPNSKKPSFSNNCWCWYFSGGNDKNGPPPLKHPLYKTPDNSLDEIAAQELNRAYFIIVGEVANTKGLSFMGRGAGTDYEVRKLIRSFGSHLKTRCWPV